MNRFHLLPALAFGVGVPMFAQQKTDTSCCSAHASAAKQKTAGAADDLQIVNDPVTALVKGNRLTVIDDVTNADDSETVIAVVQGEDGEQALVELQVPESGVLRVDNELLDVAIAGDLQLESSDFGIYTVDDLAVDAPTEFGVLTVNGEELVAGELEGLALTGDFLLNTPEVVGVDTVGGDLRIIDLAEADAQDVLLVRPDDDEKVSKRDRRKAEREAEKAYAEARKEYEKALKQAQKALDKAQKDLMKQSKSTEDSRAEAEEQLRDAEVVLRQRLTQDGERVDLLRRRASGEARERYNREMAVARERAEAGRLRAREARERAEQRLRVRAVEREDRMRDTRVRRDASRARRDAAVKSYIIRRDGTDEETRVELHSPKDMHRIHTDTHVIELGPEGHVDVVEVESADPFGGQETSDGSNDIDALLDQMRDQMAELRAEMRELRQQLRDRRDELR